MTVRTETAEFMSQHADGVGTLADLRAEWGPVGELSEFERDDDGNPTEATLERFRHMEGVDARMRFVLDERGAVWTVYEELTDTNITRKGRVYLRNSLKLYAHGDRTRILGWVVTAKGSGSFYKTYLVADGETL